jgi:hypothetical protein
MRLSTALVSLVLAVAVCHESRVEASELRLAEFRRIVVADKPSAVDKAAAEELALYVGRLRGADIPLVALSDWNASGGDVSFFVGDAPAKAVLGASPAPWKQEEWLLRLVPQGLVLAGDEGKGDPWSISTRAGAMLAVYTLLDDHLGVRWFWPGPFGEHVPSSPDAAIPPIDRRETPRFEIRSIQLGYSGYHTPGFHEQGRKWARRNRLGWTKSAVFGHSWEAAFHLRTGEDFREHPEWFALVNGQRRPPQMCTTNPDVIQRMVDTVVTGKPVIGNISPSDGGGFCECDRCRALDVPGILSYDGKHPQLSDRIFTYANEVARRVAEKDPERGVGMFAYTYYNKPPVRISRLESNLYLSFVFQSASHRDPEAVKLWRESVAGWQALGAKLVAREGWGNHYYHDLPLLHYRQILDNAAEADRLGFIAMYGEGSKSFCTQAPNTWAITRAMWEPSRDAERTMSDFFTSAYGPVSPQMRAYFETYQTALDRNWDKRARVIDTPVIAYANIIGSWSKLIPPEAVAEAERHLAEAEKLAPPGEYADRVAFHRVGQDYTAVMLELLDLYRRLGLFGGEFGGGSAAKGREESPDKAAERAGLLERAYALGERREDMLLAHRDWAAMDEGLYAFTNDRGIRQWHTAVKKELSRDTPTRLTKALLKRP